MGNLETGDGNIKISCKEHEIHADLENNVVVSITNGRLFKHKEKAKAVTVRNDIPGPGDNV